MRGFDGWDLPHALDPLTLPSPRRGEGFYPSTPSCFSMKE
jgi:hypothetical protein